VQGEPGDPRPRAQRFQAEDLLALQGLPAALEAARQFLD
jgi:hypothetical protein